MVADAPHRLPLAGAVPWLALAAIVALTAGVRLRLAEVPLERDEGGYAYFAQRWLRGEPPLASGYTMHLPGTAAMYAASLTAFGESTRGVRLGLAVASAIGTLFAFLAGRALYGGAGAVATAASYAVLSLSPSMLGPFGHAGHFIDLFAMAGLWAFVHGLRPGRRLAWLASAGLLLGFAPVMKQTGAVFPAFALAWLLVSRWRAAAPRDLAREAATLLGASLVGLLATLAVLAAGGVLPLAERWFLEYPRSYAGMQPLDAGLRMLGLRLASIVPPATGFVLLAVAGLVLPVQRRDGEPPDGSGRAFVATLLVFSLAGVSAGLYFRQHYFLLAIPAASLLVGRGVAVLGAGSRRRLAVSLAALALSCTLALALDREVLFALPPDAVSRRIFGANPFPESMAVARYLAEHARDGDRVAVLGSEPQIYFQSRLRAATRYMYLYPLVEPNPLGPAMQAELAREIEEARPAFVVWVGSPSSWDSRVAAARPLVEWAGAFVDAGYDLVGRAAILGPDRTEYAWGEDAVRLGPGGASLLVFRRR
jgi:4-amino-4-deoxy-L-arabinose transferase-like glycosyltransferase